jgi:hypothetical protein
MTEVRTPFSSYTQEEFLQGTPEQMLQATAEDKILLTWLHGDELLGGKVGHHIATQRPDLLEHVNYICGNPEAAALQPAKRYTQSDLNRSFNPQGQPTTYEETRAAWLKQHIAETDYKYVLDVHTSKTDVDRFLLIGMQRNQAIDRMVEASVVDRIVVMPEHIAKAGLIGHIPQSVSIEYNAELADEVGVEETIQMIDGLVSGGSLVTPKDREFFYVDKTILKTEDPGNAARNFEYYAAGDYYPVLYGENTYRTDPTKNYLGFAATQCEIVTL